MKTVNVRTAWDSMNSLCGREIPMRHLGDLEVRIQCFLVHGLLRDEVELCQLPVERAFAPRYCIVGGVR